MAATPQSQAISLANQALAIDAQIASLKIQVDGFLLAWADDGAATILAAMQTRALNADGSLAASPDGTPNPAHPIDVTAYPSLSRAISSNDLNAIVGYPIPNFQTMCNGLQVAAVGGMRAIINKATGG